MPVSNTQKNQYKNIVNISGTIVKKTESNNRIYYVIATDGGNRRESSFPTVILKKDQGFPDFQMSDEVDVVCILHSKTYKNNRGKNVFVKELHVTDISRRRRMLSQAGIDLEEEYAGGAATDRADFLFAGEVWNVFEANSQCKLISLIYHPANTPQRIEYLQVVCFSKAIEALGNVKKGDFLIVTGIVETDNIEGKGKMLSFVAKDCINTNKNV